VAVADSGSRWQWEYVLSFRCMLPDPSAYMASGTCGVGLSVVLLVRRARTRVAGGTRTCRRSSLARTEPGLRARWGNPGVVACRAEEWFLLRHPCTDSVQMRSLCYECMNKHPLHILVRDFSLSAYDFPQIRTADVGQTDRCALPSLVERSCTSLCACPQRDALYVPADMSATLVCWYWVGGHRGI
jgi:hypothetical protein